MAITCIEKPTSRPASRGNSPSLELIYTIEGTADEQTALDTLDATAPASRAGLYPHDRSVDPVVIDSDNEAACVWEGTVRYGNPESNEPDVGESAYSFDTGGGTQHVTQAKATVASYKKGGGTAPDVGKAIGVNGDDVAGVDIAVPVYQFSETHYLDDADVTTAYRGTLFALTGKVNDSSFKGLAAGECLFLGASGSKRGNGDWEITFKFAASPNATSLTVGTMTGIAKKGWEYLWAMYGKTESNGRVVQEPVAAYVEQVYEWGSFSNLGIGT